VRMCVRRLRVRLRRRRTLEESERTMLNGIQTAFQQLKTRLASQPNGARPPGGVALYHYDVQSPGERSRVHLRIDADGSGLVLVNANRVMHLNPSAATMARLALEATPAEEAIRLICKAYQVSTEQAAHDYTQFTETLQELIRPGCRGDGAVQRPAFGALPHGPGTHLPLQQRLPALL
jgi:hypothetical protein